MKPEIISDIQEDAESHLSSVFNAMRLMKIFTDESYEIGLSELSRRLALPKSSVHRLATALAESNMLSHNEESGKYRLGMLMFELASLMERTQKTGAAASTARIVRSNRPSVAIAAAAAARPQ